jgi:hypothetical protein
MPKDTFKMCPIFLLNPVGDDLEYIIKDEEDLHLHC